MRQYLVFSFLIIAAAIIISLTIKCDSCGQWFQEAASPTSTPQWEVAGSGNWQDRIKVNSLKPGDFITSPLVLTGEARGMWFFEATFPVALVDWDGRIIAETYAEAQSDPATGEINWMTENYVPFKATLNFEKPDYGERGAIILQRDNPSGLAEHDAALEIPIRFK